MRTDAIIDRKQVNCPNASMLGFGKHKAQVGDLILYTEALSHPAGEHRTRTARMIGRVHYAPALTGDKQPIRDYILVLVMGDMLEHVYERWVNPQDVLRVESPESPDRDRDRKAVLDCFLSADLIKTDITEVRACFSEGWSTLAKYREHMAKRAADLVDYEKRHSL